MAQKKIRENYRYYPGLVDFNYIRVPEVIIFGWML